jgi:hypothetical protein
MVARFCRFVGGVHLVPGQRVGKGVSASALAFRSSLAISIGLSVVLAGCGSNANRPKLGKVSGKVTYKGQAVTAGTVTFTPITGKGGDSGDVASGQIESNGSYTLTTFDTGDGAVLGQHAVTVVVHDGSADLKSLNTRAGADMSKPGSVQPRYVLPKLATPKKYSDPATTPFKYTVTAEPKVIDLELKE